MLWSKIRYVSFVFVAMLAFCLAGTQALAQVDVSGSNGGDGTYGTLKAAFDAINLADQTGMSIGIAITGDTDETAGGTAVLNAGLWTSLSIQPSGGAARTISGAMAAGYGTIQLNGADNVTIDGLNSGGNSLTIINTTAVATTSTCTIHFINGATFNTITRTTILGSFTGSAPTNGGNIFFHTDAGTTGNDNNIISYCNLGPAGTNFPTKTIHSSGSANLNNDITIDNNNIFDYFSATTSSTGIYLGGNTSACTISNNRFYQTTPMTHTAGNQHSAIWIANSSGVNHQIIGNTIGFASSAGTGVYTIIGVAASKLVPIYLSVGTTIATSVQGNLITGIDFSGAMAGTGTSGPIRGIYVASGLVNTGNVTGNTIGDMSTTGSITYTTSATSNSDLYGYYNYGSSPTIISNNQIGGILGTNSSTGAVSIYCIRVYTGSSVSITAENNIIGGTVANSIQSTTTATGTLVHGFYDNSSPCTFTNNVVRNLTAAGGTGTTTGASVVGVAIAASSANHTVQENRIYNLSNTNVTDATWITGIQFTASTGTNLVARNLIYELVPSSDAAIVNGIYITGGTTTYRNNMIGLGNGITTISPVINGIAELASGVNNLYHNSVYIGGDGVTAGAGNSFAFQSSVITNVRNYRDNIFMNARSNAGGTGIHYALRVGGTAPNPAGLTSDNNVLYVIGTGGTLGLFNGVDQASLAQWRVATGQDYNSFSSPPMFLAPTAYPPDLHIHPTNPTVIESSGADVGVVDDYDGETRATLTPTDIGADAGNFVGSDQAAPVIAYSPLGNTASLANRTLGTTITDATGVETGTYAPRIYYNKNAGTYYSQACVSTGGDGWDCQIVVADMGGVVLGDIVYYYVIAQDTAGPPPNVGSNPAGVTATDVLTVTSPPPTLNEYTIVPGMSGDKYVGTTNDASCPTLDYPTITAAVTALNGSELTGATRFFLCDADYSTAETFPITIEENSGSAATRRVTIKPYTGLTTTVSGSSTAALFKANGTDFLTIDGSNATGGITRDMTLSNTNTTGAVVWIGSEGIGAGATYVVIRNLVIQAGSLTSTNYGIFSGSGLTATPGTAGADNDNVTIRNNLIQRAFYGVSFRGTVDGTTDNLLVVGNTVGGELATDYIGRYGLVAEYASGANINDNTVRNVVTATSNPFGMQFGVGFVNSAVEGNIIDNVRYTGTGGYGGKGLEINTNNATSNLLIANNAISNVRGDGWSAIFGDGVSGIRLLGTSGGIKLYYNSVYLGYGSYAGYNTTTVSAALAIQDTVTDLDIQNNALATNLVNTANAGALTYAIYSLTDDTAFTVINNNDYYATGSQGVLGYLFDTAITTLVDWQTATGQDVYSIDADPSFNSATNLQPNPGSPLIGAGAYVADVLEDILNVVRDTTTPTIGAYEEAADTVGPTILYTLLPNTTSTSSFTFTGVTVTDASGVNGTSGTRPRVYYKRSTDANAWNDNTNGTDGWKWVEATGSTSPFDFAINYNLLFGGTGVTQGDTVQYFVVAQDMAPTPNVSINSGVFTAQPASVALTAAAFPIGDPINSYMILPTMSGVMYIGVVNDANCPQLDYNTITDAVTALNGSVLNGATTFYLCDADYSTSETFPIVIEANSGSNSTNTVTFKPYTGLTTAVTGSGNAIIKLNGADYMTIDGSNAASGTTRDLTMTNTGTSGVVLWLGSASTSNGASNNMIANTIITGASADLPAIVGVIAGSGTTLGNAAEAPNSNNTITNNMITACQNAAYIMGNATNLDQDWVITGNTFGSSDAPDQLRFRGMLIGNSQNFAITDNVISGVVSSASSTSMMSGIFISGVINGGDILANEIFNIKQMNTGGYGCNALYFGATSTESDILIANNVIYDVAGYGYNGTGANDNGHGIFINSGGGYRFYYNSVRLTTDQTSTSSITAAMMISNTFVTDGGLDFQNNAFTTTQTVGNRYAIYCGAVNTVFSTIDYNDYFKGTATNLGFLGGAQVDLTAWQLATGQDTNSVEDDPLFNSTTNLQPSSGSPLVGAGAYIADVLVDILGVTRDTTNPTIGAYENEADSSGPTISYTALGNTLDDIGPRILDNVTITDDSGVDTTTGTAPRVYYKRLTDANTFIDNTNLTDGWKWVEASGTTSPFDFSIDYTLLNGGTGVAGGETVQYFVVAQDLAATPNVGINAGVFAAQPTSVALTAAAFPISGTINTYTIVNYLYDFEAADDEDFTHTTATADSWERGTPNGGNGAPTAAFSGNNCWGTDLTGDYEVYGDYNLYSPIFKATGTTVLWSFWEYYTTESGYDYMYPEYSINSGAWTLAPAIRYSGAQAFWAMKSFNITVAVDDIIQFRFRLTSDSAYNYAGWYVDDMAIAGAELVDLIPPDIDYTPLTNTLSTTPPRNFPGVTVTDSTGVNTTSGTAPRVYFKRSTDGNAWNDNTNSTDGWKWAEANGTTSPFDFNIDYTLLNGGTGVTAGTIVQYFVVAQDTAAVPNVGINSGTFAAVPASVDLTSAAFPIGGTINSYAISVPLSGTYDVPGGTYGSLTNVGGIFEALNNGVLQGNVIVDITADLTGETGEVWLGPLSEDPPASNFTITIKPSGGARSITGTGTDVDLVVLAGVDRVTIDGSLSGGTDRSLTINNPNTLADTTAIGIYSLSVGEGSTDITIKNCIVETGDIGNIDVDTLFGIYASGADNDNLTIQNNVIHKTTLGLYAAGVSGGELDNPTIIDNYIGDAVVADSIGYLGIQVSYSTGAIVSGNTVNNVTCADYLAMGLNMSYSTNAMVTENTITNLEGVYTNPRGILLGTDFVNSTVTRNTVVGVHYVDTEGYGGRGIEVNTGNATSNLLIANNFVADITGDGWSSTTWGTDGLFIRGTTGGVNIYHNTVFLGSGNWVGATSCISAAFAVEASVTALDVRNNIFATNLYDTANPGSVTYAIYSDAPNTAFTVIDYNDYYVISTQAVLGYLGAAQPTLLAWQTATGQDANSFDVDPAFVSPTDLHIDITQTPPLVGMAVAIPGMVDDIDGEVRHASMPDIGADELWWAAVGDGYGAETPLAITKNGVNIDLAWGAGCGMAADDYVIYEGSIAALGTTGYDHADYSGCTTLGATSVIGYAPQAGDRYFLIVPVIGDNVTGVEGSYGLDSTGTERDQAAIPCRPFQNTKTCP